MNAQTITKGSKIKINGETVIVDSVCGNYVYFYMGEGDEREYCWIFLYELTN